MYSKRGSHVYAAYTKVRRHVIKDSIFSDKSMSWCKTTVYKQHNSFIDYFQLKKGLTSVRYKTI